MVDYKDIENVYKDRNWWDLLWNLKIAKYITYYIANYTKITPNQVTFLSFVIAILSGFSFWNNYFILGAFLFQLSYVLDIVDGALARVTNQFSKYGAFLDVFTDWFKVPFLLMILFYKLNMNYIGEFIIFLYFLNCCATKYNDMLFYTEKQSLTKNKSLKKSIIGKYFDFMKSKKLIPLPSTIEIEGLLLFLFPITKKFLFVYFAIGILLFQFLLKTYIIMKKLK